MQRYFENLRKKPKAVRAQVGFVFASAITSVFFLVWAIGLADRMSVESADPTIAQYQKELAEKDRVAKSENQGISSLFGQLKRGVAAVIFNKETVEPEEKTLEDKVIDINAMIQNPQPRKVNATTDADPQIVVPSGDEGAAATGSVILIGTTTSSNSAETSN